MIKIKRVFKRQPRTGRSLKRKVHGGAVTLLYGTKEDKYNNAAALKEYLEAE